MKRFLIATWLIACVAMTAHAQLKKVYNEEINPVKQIEQALADAKESGKFVICQVGGNWCPWCLSLYFRFIFFIDSLCMNDIKRPEITV